MDCIPVDSKYLEVVAIRQWESVWSHILLVTSWKTIGWKLLENYHIMYTLENYWMKIWYHILMDRSIVVKVDGAESWWPKYLSDLSYIIYKLPWLTIPSPSMSWPTNWRELKPPISQEKLRAPEFNEAVFGHCLRQMPKRLAPEATEWPMATCSLAASGRLITAMGGIDVWAYGLKTVRAF